MHPQKQKVIDIFGKDPASLQELAECTIAVINHTLANSKDETRPVHVVGFKWEIRYDKKVSNSHYAPLSGTTNWGGRKSEGTPLGYPGWQGRVWIRFSVGPHLFGSNGFRQTLTYPGTGGWGADDGPWKHISSMFYRKYGSRPGKNTAINGPACYSWDYRFFEDDFPALRQWREKQELFPALQNQKWNDTHIFEWNDPATVEADNMFLQLLKEEADA
jgi:hypothetical protein